MKQPPCNLFLRLKDNLKVTGFKQSKIEPYLFSNDEVICLCYVDDCLFYAPSKKHIGIYFEEMEEVYLDFYVENEMSGFLGVDLHKHDDGSIEPLQTGLIDIMSKVLGLESAAVKLTPPEYGVLGKDSDGPKRKYTSNYTSVVRMLKYLTSKLRPELSFSMH